MFSKVTLALVAAASLGVNDAVPERLLPQSRL